MLASVIQSGSRLEVKSRTEFVENVAGFILVRDTPYLKLYLKVTKKSSSAQISPIDKGPNSARIGAIFSKGGETENVALLLCCFVALSIVHTCMPSSLLSN